MDVYIPLKAELRANKTKPAPLRVPPPSTSSAHWAMTNPSARAAQQIAAMGDTSK